MKSLGDSTVWELPSRKTTSGEVDVGRVPQGQLCRYCSQRPRASLHSGNDRWWLFGQNSLVPRPKIDFRKPKNEAYRQFALPIRYISISVGVISKAETCHGCRVKMSQGESHESPIDTFFHFHRQKLGGSDEASSYFQAGAVSSSQYEWKRNCLERIANNRNGLWFPIWSCVRWSCSSTYVFLCA